MGDISIKTKFFSKSKSRSPQKIQPIKLEGIPDAGNKIVKVSSSNSISDTSKQATTRVGQEGDNDSDTESIASTSSVADSMTSSISLKAGECEIIFAPEEPPETFIDTSDIDFSTSSDLCSHENIVKEGGLMICENCGVELYEEISHEQDWRYFGNQDSGAGDPSRCQYRKSPDKGIKKELERLGFPPDICESADLLYMKVTKGDIKRSELRKGIMFACVYESYKIKNRPQTPDVLQKKFGLDRKSMSQGITYYRLRIPREYFKYEDISAKHFIPEIMKKLKITQNHIDKVVLLYEKIKNTCSIINRSNPQSTSKSLVYYYLRRKGCNINITRFGRIVGLSEIIILRLSGEISRILGSTDIVSLV